MRSTSYDGDFNPYEAEEHSGLQVSDRLCLEEPKIVECDDLIEAKRRRDAAIEDASAARAELTRLRAEIAEAERVKDGLGDVEALSWIDRVLNGEVTHIVSKGRRWDEDRRVQAFSVEKMSWAERKNVVALQYSKDRDGRGKWLWVRRDYYSTEERNEPVEFCFSEAEAHQKAGEIAARDIRELLKESQFRHYNIDRIGKLLALHAKDGLPIPADVLEEVEAARQKLRAAEAEELRQRIEAQKQKLSAMTGGEG